MFSLDMSQMSNQLIAFACALGFGLITAFVYSFRRSYSRNMFMSLVILPLIVDVVVTLINGNAPGNVGIGIAIAGAFSMLRFRSAPGTALDITYVFLTLGAGLTCATGQIVYGGIVIVIVLAVLMLFKFIPIKGVSSRELSVKITMPENVNYVEAFKDIFSEFCASFDIVKTKTTNMGSTFEVTYKVMLKVNADEKALVDKLRERNGNLPIVCNKMIAGEEL